MKPNLNWGGYVLLLLGTLTLTACSKKTDVIADRSATGTNRSAVTRPLKIDAKGYHRIAPCHTTGMVKINGHTYTTGHYLPATARGNASQIGDVSIQMNAQMYMNVANPAGLLSQPVRSITSYPNQSQDPASSIMSGDFTDLSTMLQHCQVPEKINGLPVSTAFYAGSDNALYLVDLPERTYSYSAPYLQWTADVFINGGSGKFAGAYGKLRVNASVNLNRQTDFTYKASGWISY